MSDNAFWAIIWTIIIGGCTVDRAVDHIWPVNCSRAVQTGASK